MLEARRGTRASPSARRRTPSRQGRVRSAGGGPGSSAGSAGIARPSRGRRRAGGPACTRTTSTAICIGSSPSPPAKVSEISAFSWWTFRPGRVDDEVRLGLHRLRAVRARARPCRPCRTCRRRAGACGGCCRSDGRARGSTRRGTATMTRCDRRSRATAAISSAGLAFGPITRPSLENALGPLPSSTTLSSSSSGRLSTTNQPRSSRSSAACDRPAPDSPVITSTSVTSHRTCRPPPRPSVHATRGSRPWSSGGHRRRWRAAASGLRRRR